MLIRLLGIGKLVKDNFQIQRYCPARGQDKMKVRYSWGIFSYTFGLGTVRGGIYFIVGVGIVEG